MASLVLVPVEAGAHTAERGLVMLLPTQYYLWGGALAVLVSFVVLSLIPARAIHGWTGARLSIRGPAVDWAIIPQTISALVVVALIVAGYTGVRDPLLNPLPLMVWTVGWIGFATLVALFGDLWRWINPWSAPVRLLRRWVGEPPFALPRALGYWPAIIGLGAIAWFEIVSIAPDDPARLADALVVYWLVNCAGMLLFGERAWRQRGEALSVYFHLLGRLAVVACDKGRIVVAWPGARLAATPPPGATGWLFLIASISGVTFDGLSGTFWWLGLNGINPLEFPGRSAVVGLNTLGLIGVWLAMAVSFGLCVAFGRHLAGRRHPLSLCLGRLALSLLPIAFAYHGAHYLTIFLVNGQYALIALSDPLGTGADWLGLGAHSVTTSFLNTLDQVTLIWQVQAALIVTGHLVAVAAAHAIALDLFGASRRAKISQIPLAVLMVAYTVLGLWLLSTPTGA